ncbi:MFS transporter, partial [Arthrobacter deserti]|nr:MFS transporter [Arthrobacter deserti]
MPSTPPAAPPHELRPPARIWKPLPLAGGLGLLYACTYLTLAAVSVIYLPLRVAELEPGGKAGALAAVSTATALLVMVGQPVIGALSDRTRSRWGRRAPWMLAGALASALALPVLGAADGLLLLGIAAAANELALNAVLAPAAAVVVDRVPVSRRGLASAASGTGFLVGSAAGALVVGAGMAGAAPLLALLVPAAVAVFVLLNPDRPEQHAPRRT